MPKQQVLWKISKSLPPSPPSTMRGWHPIFFRHSRRELLGGRPIKSERSLTKLTFSDETSSPQLTGPPTSLRNLCGPIRIIGVKYLTGPLVIFELSETTTSFPPTIKQPPAWDHHLPVWTCYFFDFPSYSTKRSFFSKSAIIIKNENKQTKLPQLLLGKKLKNFVVLLIFHFIICCPPNFAITFAIIFRTNCFGYMTRNILRIRYSLVSP